MTQEISRRLIDGVWVTSPEAESSGGGGGGSTPGAIQVASLRFTEETTPGTYTATLDVVARTLVLGANIRPSAGPWACDSSTLNVGDGINYERYFSGITPTALEPFSISAPMPGVNYDNAALDGNVAQLFTIPAASVGLPIGMFYADSDTITAELVTTTETPPVVAVGVFEIEFIYCVLPAADAASFVTEP